MTDPDPARLTLVADPAEGLVGPKTFGKLVAEKQGRTDEHGACKPYTSQSVTNWVNRGACSVAHEDQRGRFYNPSHAATVAENIPAPTRGGARRGSGRKKTKAGNKTGSKTGLKAGLKAGLKDNQAGSEAPLAQEMDKAAKAKTAIEAFLERVKDDEQVDPSDAVHVSELLNITRQEFRAVLAVYGTKEYGMSPAMMGVLDRWLDDRAKEMRFQREAGELIKKDDMIAAIHASQAPVVEMLSALPVKVTETIAPHCWVSESTTDSLIAMLYHMLGELGIDRKDPEVVATLDEIRTMLARPAPLEATLRTLIAGAVDGARTTLVQGMTSP